MKTHRLLRLSRLLVLAGIAVLSNGIAIAQLELPWEKDKGKGDSKEPAISAAPLPSTPFADSTTAPVPVQSPRSQGANLFKGGDFSQPNPVDGDGNRGVLSKPGTASQNHVWRLMGPDEMGFFKALSPAPGRGNIGVRFRILIPLKTVVDPEMPGIRIRVRLMDRHESSAINDRILQPAGQWQTIECSFSDTRSGPYTLGLEAFGFTGPIYFDDIEARSIDVP